MSEQRTIRPPWYGNRKQKTESKTDENSLFRSVLHKRSRLPVFVMVKYALGYRVRKAYRAGDREALVVIADDFARTERLLKKFIKSFSAQWNEECKPFGFEKHDLRLGGLLQRLSHCRRRLGEYAEGRSDRIEELEEEILPFRKGAEDGETLAFNDWLYTFAVKPGL